MQVPVLFAVYPVFFFVSLLLEAERPFRIVAPCADSENRPSSSAYVLLYRPRFNDDRCSLWSNETNSESFVIQRIIISRIGESKLQRKPTASSKEDAWTWISEVYTIYTFLLFTEHPSFSTFYFEYNDGQYSFSTTVHSVTILNAAHFHS
jgi:hypothetical protein